MKITITRSFERTRQIADFVPIKAYCEVSAEIEIPNVGTQEEIDLALSAASSKLDKFAHAEVNKTLAEYRPTCIICGGRGDRVNLNKEGVCGDCMNQRGFQTKEFATTVNKIRKEKQPPATGTKVESPN